MDVRVSQLETHIDYMSRDIAEIKASIKTMAEAISSLTNVTTHLSAKIDATELKITTQMSLLPTKDDLKNYNLQYLAIGFATFILVVGGIVGGLD